MLAAEPQDRLRPSRKRTPADLGIDELRLLEHELALAPPQTPLTGRLQIAQPVHFTAIGQLDHEATVYRPDHDGDLVLLAAAPANVAQERERTEGEFGGVAQNGIDEPLDEGPYALLILAHLLAP